VTTQTVVVPTYPTTLQDVEPLLGKAHDGDVEATAALMRAPFPVPMTGVPIEALVEAATDVYLERHHLAIRVDAGAVPEVIAGVKAACHAVHAPVEADTIARQVLLHSPVEPYSDWLDTDAGHQYTARIRERFTTA
jgi:hypothetical protein